MRQIRLALFVWIINATMWLLPKDCPQTYKWLSEIPMEDKDEEN